MYVGGTWISEEIYSYAIFYDSLKMQQKDFLDISRHVYWAAEI